MTRYSFKKRVWPEDGSDMPAEFAIEPAKWPDDLHQIIRKLCESSRTQNDDRATHTDHTAFFAGLATRLWRVRQKMLKPGTDEPLDETRSSYKHLLSVFDLLEQQGIRIRDHTHELFDSGMMVNVIAYETSAEHQRDLIIETIKPTVFYAEEPIQIADVIVGTPECTKMGD